MRAPFLAFPVPAPMAAPLPAPTAAPVTVPQPVVTIASKVNPASIRMTRVFIIGFSSYFRLSPILLLALGVISLIRPVSWTLRASLSGERLCMGELKTPDKSPGDSSSIYYSAANFMPHVGYRPASYCQGSHQLAPTPTVYEIALRCITPQYCRSRIYPQQFFAPQLH